MSQELSTGTICIQDGWQPKNGESGQFPVYQNTTFRYETSEQMGRLFDLEEDGYFRARLVNPTNGMVTSKIRELGGGVGAMLTSSGQAASLFAIINLCSTEDHVVNSATLYGGASNLFAVTLKRFGIDFTLVNPDAPEREPKRAFQPSAKAVFGETITNPALVMLDIEKFTRLAHKHGVPLILDNIFATLINCRSFEWEANIVTHSITKHMGGHALTVGDYIIDNGNLDWKAHREKFSGLATPDDSYHGIICTRKFGKMICIIKATAQLIRDLGPIQAPENALLLNIGLEILYLRMPRHYENTLRVTRYLQSRDDVAWINCPDLGGGKYHELAKKYMPDGTYDVISFYLEGGREGAVVFMDKLKLASTVTHVADTRACVLHPANHIHRQLNGAQLREVGVDPAVIRLSVGIENVDDIIADLEQALN